MNKWPVNSCEINGITISYQRTGGDKPSVILLHGLTMNGNCWTSLACALQEDYDVIMPDARGHGFSSSPSQGYCYDNLAADVFGLINALGIVSPVLIGHSMGGLTAAVVANKYPEQIRGLVLADPTFLTPQRQTKVYESNGADEHLRIIKRLKSDYLSVIRMRHPHRSSEVSEQIAEARFQTSIHAFEILKPPNPDYVQLVKNLNIPTLLVIGGVNGVISPEIASELAGLNQCLKVVQIKEAGHGIPFDEPKLFSGHVKAFLDALE